MAENCKLLMSSKLGTLDTTSDFGGVSIFFAFDCRTLRFFIHGKKEVRGGGHRHGRLVHRPPAGPGPRRGGAEALRGLRWLRHCEGSGKLDRARSRLYRGQILQENMRLKALAEIYTMHSFAQLCNLIFSVKISHFRSVYSL